MPHVSKVIITNLKLVNFRSHKSASFNFGDGTNLIVGGNGTGKTNILEAIELLSTGKSFRARYDYEMIYNPSVLSTKTTNEDKKELADYIEFARVVGITMDDGEKESLETSLVKSDPYSRISRKTFKVNGTPKPIQEASTYLNTVLFCPQDLELFNGSPTIRREFLDDLLCKIDQKYKKEHGIYTRAVRQRNRILEKINKFGVGANELDFWTEKILESGVYLQEKRSELITALNSQVGSVFCDISVQRSNVVIDYKINQITRPRLEKHREHEIYAKTTLVGPHRDDFEFLINGFNIGHYGSRGQQRTGILTLKICELDIINITHLIDQKNSDSPVLLLDDIFSELDDTHRKALEEVVQKQQTIITSTHRDIKAQNVITL